MTEPGLRERKKQATRQLLSRAALRLAVERGVENIRGDDIADEAGVAPRTFRNYFANKYEAIVAPHVDRTLETATELRNRPASEPLWTAVEHAMVVPYRGLAKSADRGRVAAMRMILDEPALHSALVHARLTADAALTAAVAARTRTNPDHDMYPRLVAGAISTAGYVAIDRWIHAESPVTLPTLIRRAVRQFAAGLPEPRRRR